MGRFLVKKGNDVIREIAIAYMTPYIRDVHDTGFQTLSSWSGTWGVLDGEQYCSSGIVDVYQDNAQISFTYQSQGNQGVKAFHLYQSGNYTFFTGGAARAQVLASNRAIGHVFNFVGSVLGHGTSSHSNWAWCPHAYGCVPPHGQIKNGTRPDPRHAPLL